MQLALIFSSSYGNFLILFLILLGVGGLDLETESSLQEYENPQVTRMFYSKIKIVKQLKIEKKRKKLKGKNEWAVALYRG